METRQRQRLLVQYAIGAYGATIRIYAGNRHLLGYFVALLTRLADGTTDRLPLEDSPLIALEGLSGLRMEVGSTGFYPIVTEESNQAGLPSFLWICDLEAWQSCRELAQPLLESFLPAHAYLTPESNNEVRVELSYAE